MVATEPTPGGSAAPWTCPFCPLLCDGFGVDTAAAPWRLIGSDCPRAHAALARFGPEAPVARATIDGVSCSDDEAIAAAARILSTSRQPLFGGLGTDVAGARALYALACRTGAICDPAGGAALSQGLRALQDRGAFTTTLAEARTRADLIVCIGGLPIERYPELPRRLDLIRAGQPPRLVVLQAAGAPTPGVDARAPLASSTASKGRPGATLPRERAGAPDAEVVSFEGDLYDAVALLAAQIAGRQAGDPDGALAGLAGRLRRARYAVLVYETSRLPAHGALILEMLNRVVATLNRKGRAATLPLGGDDGASTVNAVATWLSGLPLRTRLAPDGLEHEPLRFDARHLVADRAVDALLWIASYGTEPAPPSVDLPRIVLGHPSAAATGRATVYIPVATPGIGAAGHLFRTDGSVLMPLRPVQPASLPTVADVLKRLDAALSSSNVLGTANGGTDPSNRREAA